MEECFSSNTASHAPLRRSRFLEAQRRVDDLVGAKADDGVVGAVRQDHVLAVLGHLGVHGGRHLRKSLKLSSGTTVFESKYAAPGSE